MNVQTTRLRMEPWAWSPAAMSMHVGHTFVFTHLNLSELATTSSKSNIGYVTLVMNTHTHTSATGPCLTVTLVRTVVHCVCALASLSLQRCRVRLDRCFEAFFLSIRPPRELTRMATASACSSTRSSSLSHCHDNEHNIWTLFLGYAVIITSENTSRRFLRKKNREELRCRAASRWISCAIRVINKLVSCRGHL